MSTFVCYKKRDVCFLFITSCYMLTHFIENKTTAYLGFSPTEEQASLIASLAVFLAEPHKRHAFLLKGYAGTGKTSVVSALVKLLDELQQPVVLLAPTGRAAKVLSSYSGKQAATIHKHIYRKKTAIADAPFEIAFNSYKNALIIVDEASMVANAGDGIFGSGRLLDDLISYVFSADNCRLLLLGDTAQLPPVLQTDSAALDSKVLEGYDLYVQEFTLTQVVRQAEASGILRNATHIRQVIDANFSFQKLCLQTDTDVIRVSGSNFTDTLHAAYRDGLEETIIVTRSNKKASMYVEGIRNTILQREEMLSTGDLVMVVKNNYFVGKEYQGFEFIANGDIAEVMRVRSYSQLYGYTFADVVVRFLDYDWEVDAKILVDALACVTPTELQEMNKKLFALVEEDYAHIGNKRARYKEMKNDVYLNALQLKFAYAITCHKAQGGQWKHVFIDMGMIQKAEIDTSFLRWLYTACTRAKDKLYLINFDDAFFC